MFCANCACELPAVAKFCVRCGSTVGPSTGSALTPVAAPPVSEPVGTTSVRCSKCGSQNPSDYSFCTTCGTALRPTGSPVFVSSTVTAFGTAVPRAKNETTGLFCNHCGTENSEYAKFCFSCGQPQVVASTDAAVHKEPLPPTPYSSFVLRLLVGLFLLAAAVFDFCQLALQRAPHPQFVRPLLTTAFALGILFVAKQSWAVVLSREQPTDRKLHKKHRRTIKYSVLIGILFILGAILFGWLIGKDRQQLQALEKDLAEYASIGGRISRARENPGKTIPDYVQMYISIESDVTTLAGTTSRLIRELGEYDADFPEFHAQTQRSTKNVSDTQRRMLLLGKQIAVAKKLKVVEDPEQRSIWISEMQPILEQEEQLDAGTTTEH
jgi:hypothetical protein